MFQLDDKFLEEVGLGSLPDDQKKLFLDHFREQLELRVGLQLSEGLSDMQLAEFESFNYREVVMQTVKALKEEVIANRDMILLGDAGA